MLGGRQIVTDCDRLVAEPDSTGHSELCIASLVCAEFLCGVTRAES